MVISLLIASIILLTITFGIHLKVMSSIENKIAASVDGSVIRYIPVLCAIVLPVIALRKLFNIHWLWLIIINLIILYFLSRWLSTFFLTRFATGHGLQKDLNVACILGVLTFAMGTYLHTEKDIIYGNKTHKNSNYKYEYRSGNPGNYTYNYDVSGTDEDGNLVTGNLDMEGKFGSGTLVDENGNEISVDAEWEGYGQITATDLDGNTYDLEVD